MRFPKHWTRAQNERGTVTARGWSETSMAEAVENAQRRLQRILNALATDRPLDHYEYVIDGVICEEVIEEVIDGGEPIAVISRNSYGATVMNTPKMMFIDIDVPQPRLGGCLLGWLRRRPPDQPTPEESHLQRLRQWQQENPGYSFRVYRTHSGIRAIVINREFSAVDTEVLRVLDELESDRLYRRLCVAQECFRARLSPKPWRVGISSTPPAKFPFRSPQEEKAFHAWHDDYVRRSKDYCVCEYLETVGAAPIAAGLRQLVDRHDASCCSDRALPLA